MRISDWSSDVCSSDLATLCPRAGLSPAGPARRKPMPSFSESLEKTLHNALKAASERHHEYATLEHLLSALIDDEHAAEVMRACGVALDELQSAVVHYLDTELDSLKVEGHSDPSPTRDRKSTRLNSSH